MIIKKKEKEKNIYRFIIIILNIGGQGMNIGFQDGKLFYFYLENKMKIQKKIVYIY